MKAKRFFISCFALFTAMAAWADVSVNATNFPDEGFRNWIKSQPYGADSLLTDAEIAGVTELQLYSNYFHSLKGIGFFTALTNLQCQNSYYLSELDVSKNTADKPFLLQLRVDVPQRVRLFGTDHTELRLQQADLPRRNGLLFADLFELHQKPNQGCGNGFSHIRATNRK